MNENTAGFYKYEKPVLHYGPNYVLDSKFELFKETKNNNTYPVDGWYWFNSVEEALDSLGVAFSEPDDYVPAG